ncbi:DUF6223 family protein [Nocardia sp. NPDC005366]|uniref:DUF6223 family protein n=1 Tax=Nocardia sp. NPDC005366 TaxID=3156878 RepID=UPI0033AEFF5B
MSIRHRLAAVAAMLGGFALATPTAAHASVQPAAAGVGTLSSGRLGAIVATLVGLTGVIIGGLALARSTGRFGNGNGAVVAVVAGPIGMAIGGLVVATSDGGVGTGNGLGGAYVALVVGLISTVLGGLGLARANRC